MKSTAIYLLFVGDRAGKASEAITFYTSLFENSEIISIERYGVGDSEPEGFVKLGRFLLNGMEYMAEDSNLNHQFTFTPAISLFVECETLEELETVYKMLLENGQELVALDESNLNQKFGWLNDKYGISWQLSFKIA